LRRASFPGEFAGEVFCGSLWPLILCGLLAALLGLPIAASVVGFAAIWFGAEMILSKLAGWPLSVAYPVYAVTRDLMLPVIWINGWLGSDFVWRGNPMSSVVSEEA